MGSDLWGVAVQAILLLLLPLLQLLQLQQRWARLAYGRRWCVLQFTCHSNFLLLLVLLELFVSVQLCEGLVIVLAASPGPLLHDFHQ
jgi:hypothetical protein